MHPIYRIDHAGENITGRFGDRLMTMTVVQHDAGETHTLDIELDDRDSALAIPPKGSSLEVYLGFKETGVTSLGTFVIETIKLSWAPTQTMSIHGKAADVVKPDLKEHRNENYENMSLGDIVGKIAGRNGLSPSLLGGLDQGNKIAMVHQTDESDMNFLTRIGRDHGSKFQIADGKLVMNKVGNTTSSSGADINFIVTPPLVKACIVSLPDRSEYGTAKASYFDFSQGKQMEVDGGGKGTGAFKVKNLMLDAHIAADAAVGRLSELSKAKADVHVELSVGDPTVSASGGLTIQGFRDGMDGSYNITSVEHNYDGGGYVTKIDGDNGGDGNDANTNKFNPRDVGLIPRAANAVRHPNAK